MSLGLRVSAPRFARLIRRHRVAAVTSKYIPLRRHRSFYDRWIGPLVILGVLVFCGVMGLAGWELITTALRH
jgi:hypothetical protein